MDKVILVIDDDQDFQMILKISLPKCGFVVRSVFDGLVSDLLMEEPVPDVILLDIDLPVANGVDVCKRIKANAATRNIPVIMVSANPYVDQLSKQVGARDYVQKPFTLQALLEKVNASLVNS
jgi:DNA-binding response OmpR family regulator